ncbi:MAG: hypothetical protein CL666_03100 [Balneola sp.]|nr:hypothetical protein [Balneola sp.]
MKKTNPDLDYDPQEIKIDADRITRSNVIGQFIQFDSKFYMNDDLFVLAGFMGDISFSGSTFEAEYTFNPQNDREAQERNRYLRADPELGIGFGRVRNIGPQIRAIRLNERYSAITNSNLTSDEIIASAEQFTKASSYPKTKDRSRKYFWSDMNQELSGKLDEISAYDIFYLDDVFSENIGQRLEGFDVLLSGKFAYYNRLNRDEETTNISDNVMRDLLIRKRVDAYSQIRWYKNLDLNHQLGFVSQHRIAFPLEKDEELEMDIDMIAQFSWLWTITDRYLLETSFNNHYEKPVFKERIFNERQYQFQSYVRSALTYFIENRLSLTGRVLLGFDKDRQDNRNQDLQTTTNSFRWQASFNLRYYFDRNLY